MTPLRWPVLLLSIAAANAGCANTDAPTNPGVPSLARPSPTGIKITDLGTLGGRQSYPRSLTAADAANSVLVIGYSDRTAGAPGAGYWRVNVQTLQIAKSLLPMVPDARQSAAYEVNQRETIVGQSLILEADGVTTTWRATRWVQGTSGWTAELIPTLHDSRHSASAINSLGQMAGGSPTATGEERFYSFDGTTVVDRGGLGGPAEVGGINVDGTIVGSVDIPKDRAAVLHVNELPVLLPDLGGQTSFATAINDLGVIVGSAMNPAGEFRAVRWTRSPTTGNYVVEDLGLSRGRAFSINNEGEIVGSFVTSRGERGFYRSKSGAIKELPIISYASIAYAINESGQVTGISWVRNTDAHAVLWTNVR